MRHATAAVLATILSLGFLTQAARAADNEKQYPLGSGRLQLSGGEKAGARRVSFSARWTGATDTMPNPKSDVTTLRILGGPGEGDSGLIRFPQGNWRALPKGKGYRYNDPHALAGGIKSIMLKVTKSGGFVRITGGTGRWLYQVAKPQSTVTVTLISGTTRWCAELASPTTKKAKVAGKTGAAPASCPCDSFPSTWEAIQSSVFVRNGCTQGACHDSTRQGGLDLRPESAYASLVGVVSSRPNQIKRVEPYAPSDSLLYLKLAALTNGTDLDPAYGSPMPSGGLAAISKAELDAVRLWIQQGAPQTGVVPQTETLLNSCLPKPEPPLDEPLDPPSTGTGVQLYAPPWEIGPRNAQGQNGENEVCYSTYYNLKGQIPDDYLIPCPTGIFDGPTNPTKQCFTYDHQLLRQSPNSHHSIIHIYNGAYPANDSGWQNQCSGGTVPDGTPCDPTQPGLSAMAGGGDCGGGYCRGKVITSVACTPFPNAYGPADFDGGVLGNGTAVAPAFSGSQQPRFERINPEGVFSILPIEGTIVWNSHAFNVFDQPVENQQWLNLWFIPKTDLKFPLRATFDASDIFIERVPPFQEVEYCRTVLYGKGTRIADFSSHTHKRGRLFRVWGPPIAQPCRSTQANPGACVPEPTAPIMTTTTYNDPAQLIYKTPFELDDEDPAQRRFKFCSIYDNGHTDPVTVKRNSTSPNALLGGKCYTGPNADKGIACMDGPLKGQPCHGDNSVCDSSPGANDGVCDACPLTGGVSTEDEMFILIGSYYCDTTVAGESCTGVCSAGPNKGQACHGNDSECPRSNPQAGSGNCLPYSNF